MDRRKHPRYVLSSAAHVLTLRDVQVEAATATTLTVLAGEPSPHGAQSWMRVTGARGREVTLRVRTEHCAMSIHQGGRRYQITYAVLEQEPARR